MVASRLAGSSIAVVGIGDLDDEVVANIEDAVTPAGASVDARAVVAVPADPAALADAAPAALRRRASEEARRSSGSAPRPAPA